MVDPSTGTCQSFPVYSCSSPCQLPTVGLPAWGQCPSACTGLSESDCLALSSCHAAYTPPASGRGAPTFLACWSLAPQCDGQTAQQPACSGLDATACAAQHWCGSLLAVDSAGNDSFTSCFVVPVTTGGTGADPGICYGTVQCNDAPPACPVGTVAGITSGCWSGYCIPTTKCPD
jgi:hypothetical protein